jgi:hypothetical protein
MKPNWNDRIKEARKRGNFTKQDILKAAEWPNCACGEQDARIERNRYGEPDDMKLWILGADFSEYVGLNDFASARQTLAKIEKRAAQIIAAMMEKKGKR